MKTTIIITGISSGIGRALVDQYLELGHLVIGIGRSNPFGDRIEFKECDLSDIQSIRKLKFANLTQKVILINNAGTIGTIGRISELSLLEFDELFRVNTTAAVELTKLIYGSILEKENFTLVNISSGAARNAIPSWAAYCASKAALNMWTECFVAEENELDNYPRVYCVAPGVVDTAMQDKIRSVKQDNFAAVQKFIDYKNEGKLFSPKEVAIKLETLLNKPFNGNIHNDLRNV